MNIEKGAILFFILFMILLSCDGIRAKHQDFRIETCVKTGEKYSDCYTLVKGLKP